MLKIPLYKRMAAGGQVSAVDPQIEIEEGGPKDPKGVAPVVVVKDKTMYDYQKTPDMPHTTSNYYSQADLETLANKGRDKYMEVYKPKTVSCLGIASMGLDYVAAENNIPLSKRADGTYQKAVNKIPRGIDPSSWQMPGAMISVGAIPLYTSKKYSDTKDGKTLWQDENIRKGLTVGSFVFMQHAENNGGNEMADSANAEQWKSNWNTKMGIISTRHTGVVIGFDSRDGMPIIDSMGHAIRMDDQEFRTNYTIAHIIKPVEYDKKENTSEEYMKRRSFEVTMTNTDFSIDNETSNQREFADNIKKHKAAIMNYTGIDDMTYNELGQLALAISEQETHGRPKVWSDPKHWVGNAIDDGVGAAYNIYKAAKQMAKGNFEKVHSAFNPSVGIMQMKKGTANDAIKGFASVNGLEADIFDKSQPIGVGKLRKNEYQAMAGMLHLIKLNKVALEKMNDPEFIKGIRENSPGIEFPENYVSKRDIIAALWNSPGTVKRNNMGAAARTADPKVVAADMSGTYVQPENAVEIGPAMIYANQVNRKNMATTHIAFHRKGGKVKNDSLAGISPLVDAPERSNPMMQEIYSMYPGLAKMKAPLLKPDALFNKALTGAGDIETFVGNESVNYPNGVSVKNPSRTGDAIVYNPFKVDKQDIALDMLHIARERDPEYKSKLEGFNKAWSQTRENDAKFFYNKEGDNGDGYEKYRENFQDGDLRNALYQASPKKMEENNYSAEAQKETLNDPILGPAVKQIKDYLTGGEGSSTMFKRNAGDFVKPGNMFRAAPQLNPKEPNGFKLNPAMKIVSGGALVGINPTYVQDGFKIDAGLVASVTKDGINPVNYGINTKFTPNENLDFGLSIGKNGGNVGLKYKFGLKKKFQ